MAIHAQTFTHSLLNVLLVLIESSLSFALRLDGRLRQLAYPLAKKETLVCIRTYLPHTEIYATFSYKGVLLDRTNIHNRPATVTINAYSHQIVSALVAGSPNTVQALQMYGEAEDVALVQDFLAQISVMQLVETALDKIRKKPTDPAEKAAEKQNKIAELSTALEQKTKQAESLQTQVAKLSTQIAELQSKQKTARIIMAVLGVLWVLTLILYGYK